MKQPPSINDIKECFEDFAKFTFQLIEDAATDARKMKFAVVNAQVALELYLKYYFLKKNDDAILKKKNGVPSADFVDFSQILNHYYTVNRWSYGNKKELQKILDARNAIVHNGHASVIDEDLALNVVCVLFFIHSTMWQDDNEFLFSQKYAPQSICNNQIWRKGVARFVGILRDIYNIMEVRTCLACRSYSVIDGQFFALTYSHAENNLICLTCFDECDIEHEGALIRCYTCSKTSYLIDRFNEQKKQLHVAKCSECQTDTWVRKCRSCEEFYHPTKVNEKIHKNNYFCSDDCLEMWLEQSKFGNI